MRKRIVIGLLAVIMASVVAFVVSSGGDTIEYHEKRVVRLMQERTAWWRKLLREVTGFRDIARPDRAEMQREIAQSLRRLRELGYWQERGYLFTNRALTYELIHVGVSNWIQNGSVERELLILWEWRVETTGSRSNVLSVWVPRKEFGRWDEFVRRTDVP